MAQNKSIKNKKTRMRRSNKSRTRKMKGGYLLYPDPVKDDGKTNSTTPTNPPTSYQVEKKPLWSSWFPSNPENKKPELKTETTPTKIKTVAP